MLTIHETFESVKTSRSKNGKCSICSKPMRCSKTFENTINPFNKNKDGSIRTYSEVLQNVERLADEWKPDFTHNKCK